MKNGLVKENTEKSINIVDTVQHKYLIFIYK